MTELERKSPQRVQSSESEQSITNDSVSTAKSLPSVPIQQKTNGEKFKDEKEQHSTPSEEQFLFASPSTLPPEDSNSSENPVQGKFKSVAQLQKGFKAPALQFKTNTIQKQNEEEEPIQQKSNPNQRQIEEEEPVQAKASNPNGLPATIQTQMEGALGADFSNVNIHTNSQSATDVGALAYTQGNDVHFAPGQYNPESSSGQELIGHELTHVVQQREGRVQPTTQAAGLPVNDDKGLEAEADAGGQRAVQMKSEINKLNIPINPNLSNDSVIQRDIPSSSQANHTSSVNFPQELGDANTNAQLAIKLILFSQLFSDLSHEISEYPNYTTDVEVLNNASRDLLNTSRRYSSRDHEANPDSGEAALLQIIINGYSDVFTREFNGLKGYISHNISTADSQEEIPELTPEIAEARRVAFESGNTSQLERLQNLVSSIQSYNSQVSTWIGRVSRVNSAVRNSTRIQQLRSLTGSISDYAEKIGQIITVMRSIDTFATGGNGSETQMSLNRFQAALDAIDVGMNFFSAVPVIGTLWSRYYYPAATSCIRALGRISQIADRDNRLLTWISSNWNNPNPPSLRGVNHSFMGGQVVFNFMWHIYFGNYQFNQGAENFFMDHKNQFNAICRPQLTIDGEWNPFVDNHIHDFQNWVLTNKNIIWSLLYGADLPYPNTGMRPGDQGQAPE